MLCYVQHFGEHVCLSCSTSHSYVEPEEVDSSDLQLLPDLCTETTLVFTRPLDMDQSTLEINSEFPMIWASCESRPDGSSSGATLEVHETGSYGSFCLFSFLQST